MLGLEDSGAYVGEFENKALPWILLSVMICGTLAEGLNVAILVSAGHPARLPLGITVALAPFLVGVPLVTWLWSYRAPRVITISPGEVRGSIRLSPLKRFKPREVRFPFDRIRKVNGFPIYAVRSSEQTGGVWFIYLSRENARRVKAAWSAWRGAALWAGPEKPSG